MAVNLDDLTLKFDRIHFDTQGQLGLGEAFANLLLFGPPDEDLDGDGLVDEIDADILVYHWSRAVPLGGGLGDVDGDGFRGPQRPEANRRHDPPGSAPRQIQRPNRRRIRRCGGTWTSFWRTGTGMSPPANVSHGDLDRDGFVGLYDLSFPVIAMEHLTLVAVRPTLSDMDPGRQTARLGWRT